MENSRTHFWRGAVSGALAMLLAGGLLGQAASGRGQEGRAAPGKESDELARLYAEDQGDRMPAPGKEIDWAVVGPRDRAREARVKELYRADRLQTGADYYHAAMILQHAPQPDDYLLAHEFCVAALAQGERRARWLAAATEDRFLMNIDRPQRFATQYRSTEANGPVRLYRVAPEVTDRLRAALDVPSLAEARRREALFNAPPKESGKPESRVEGKNMSLIALHPENPHYFLFRGRPAFLITSGEHYGAVLNRDFDYRPYLDELHARGFNLTRTFSGAYHEVPGSFKIENNTLAPLPGRDLCPWARTGTPGAGDGGAKYDLRRWDEAYFRRLRDFCRAAGPRGIVVELVLFCPFYEEGMWSVSPMKASNNVNGVGDLPRTEVYTLKNGGLLALQEAMVRKIVGELRELDNVYYEICNEPYFGGVTAEWQARIAAAIRRAEDDGGPRHLIAQNIANGSAKVAEPNPAVSIFNFHYAHPPEAVAVNFALNRAIADDETGFRGTEDTPYRTEAWDFFMAGGSVFSNLDYSFTAAHPDGTAPVRSPTPGGGGPALRGQLKILRDFLAGFDFVRLKPANEVVQGGVPAGATVRALAEPGKAYAIYVKGGPAARLSLALPAGHYRVEWVNPRTGTVERSVTLAHAGGEVALDFPPYAEDITLRILRAVK
jgi:hypothetical protein